MHFRTVEDCRRRARELGVPLIEVDSATQERLAMPSVRFSIEGVPNAAIALARMIQSWLGDFRDCEFWISEFGIWPSSEDWNLYDRLRSTYGDSRRLYQAPGHLFGAEEKQDLATFLGIAIKFAWGGHLIPNPPDSYVFLSHDEWVHAASKDGLAKIIEDLESLDFDYEVSRPRRPVHRDA